MPYYINQKHTSGPWRGVETIDEFSTRREANKMLAEYIVAFNGADLYISTRPDKTWKKPAKRPFPVGPLDRSWCG